MLISIRRFGVLTAAVSCAALVAAAPASAKVKVPKVAVYNVEFTGSGGYDVNGTDSNGDGTAVKAIFHWDAKYQKLIFIRKSGTLLSTVISPKKTKAGGDWSISATSSDPGDSCNTSGTFKLGPAGGIDGKVQGSGKVTFRAFLGLPGFDTVGGDNGTTACSTTDFWHDWPINFSKVGVGDESTDATDPITAFSTFDLSDFNHGKIVDNVSNVTLKNTSLVPSESCGGDAGTSCTQHFNWYGHLIFTKTKI